MITILTGNNHAELKRAKAEQISAFIKLHGEHAVEQFDASNSSYEDMLGSLQSMPFLASNKLVIVSDLGANKQAAENIEKLLDSVIEQVDLLIYLPTIDKRSVLYKTLKKQAGFTEFKALDESQLVAWLVERARAKKYELSSSDARYLVSYVGADQLKLGNELDKLGNYKKRITRDSIEELSVKSIQSTTFDMLDAAFAGKSESAVRYYQEQRTLGVEPQIIMGALVWQIRVLLALKFSKHDLAETARMSKFSPYSLSKAKRLADSISKNKLKELVASVLELDIKTKSKPIDIDEAIMNQLIKIGKLDQE